jgi:hypothetical protein
MKKTILFILTCLITSPIISQNNSTLPTQGLELYYPFNGNANDLSGNGNNGTVAGATLTADRFGVVKSAYSFDGSTSTIDAEISWTVSFPLPLQNLVFRDGRIQDPSAASRWAGALLSERTPVELTGPTSGV